MRHVNGADDTTCSLPAQSPTTRGFTNQEQIPSLCLDNYNARIYDPQIGRFMSADSVVPDPFNGQSFNRYSYVNNGPLGAVDPTGHDSLGCGENNRCVSPDDFNFDPEAGWGDSGFITQSAFVATPIAVLDNKTGELLGWAFTANQLVSILASNYDLTQRTTVTGPNGTLTFGMASTSVFTAGTNELEGQGSAFYSDFQPASSTGRGYGSDTNGGFQDAGLLLGNHDYNTANMICAAAWHCSAGLVGSIYSQVRNGIPGNNSSAPIVSGNTYTVYQNGVPVGQVQSYVGQGGLTVDNVTLPDHIPYNGYANRNAVEVNGAWYSVTHGSGTNYYGGAFMATANQVFGPGIFNNLDMSIASQLYTATHH